MDSKIKAIVVDDELEAREGLRILLEGDKDITLVTSCKNGIEAIEALTEFKIDLMFLDIQMPVVDGFEVVRSVPADRIPLIIFCTAYDQYAVKAFEVHAVDYLLKPFTDERFLDALTRSKEIIRQKQQEASAIRMKEMAGSMLGNQVPDNVMIEMGSERVGKKMVIKEGGKVHFLNIEDITWIEAFDYYIKIHVGNKFYTIRESMKRMAERLSRDHFARVHKSSIINLDCIKTIDLLGNGGYQVHLLTGEKLKVSRGFKDSLKHLITK